MYERIIVQGIGFVAAGLLIASFQCKRSRRLFTYQMCACIVYIIHFYLLGAMSGSGNQFVGLVRGFIYSNRGKKWADSEYWPAIIVALNVIVMLLTWVNYMSIFPFLGMVGITIAGAKGNGKHVRLANLCLCSPSWLIYDIYSHSIPGILCETFIMTSIIISVFRYGWEALDGDGED